MKGAIKKMVGLKIIILLKIDKMIWFNLAI